MFDNKYQFLSLKSGDESEKTHFVFLIVVFLQISNILSLTDRYEMKRKHTHSLVLRTKGFRLQEWMVLCIRYNSLGVFKGLQFFY